MRSAEATTAIAGVMEKFGVPSSRWAFLGKPSRITYLGEDRNGLPARYAIRLKRSWNAETLKTYLTKCLIAVRRGEELPPAPTRAARVAAATERKKARKAAMPKRPRKTRQSDLPVVTEDPAPSPQASPRKGRGKGRGSKAPAPDEATA